MVYSTCSMNPIENEAVVAEVHFDYIEKLSIHSIDKWVS